MKDNIKKLRKELGYTQQVFAVKLNVSLTTVQNWESGRRSPSRMAMDRIENIKRILEHQ